MKIANSLVLGSLALLRKLPFYNFKPGPFSTPLTGSDAADFISTPPGTPQERIKAITLAMDATGDAIGMTSADGRHIYQNRAFDQLFGYTLEEVSRLQPAILYANKDDARQVFETIMAGKPWRGEIEMLAKNGRRFPVSLRADVVKNEDGQIIGLVGVHSDITESNRVDNALRASELRTRAITDSAQDAIMMIDPAGLISFWNSAAERILGYTPAEALGMHLHTMLVPERYQAAHHSAFPHFLRTGQGNAIGKTLELNALRKDREEICVALSLSAIQLEGEWHAIGIMRDITAQKETEQELREARDAAEESVRVKSEFLANMSHEIRTPMNGVIGMAQLLEDTELSTEQREYVEALRQSGELLIGIINDILDLSKIEAGMLGLNPVDFDLRSLIDTVTKLLAPRLSERDLVWIPEIAPEMPPLLRGDSLRLQQVLMNLLSNAVKFTPLHGAIMLHVTVESQDESGTRVGFFVSDTGIGIPAEKQELIFQAFTQADGSTTRQFGGTGLGLTISERLVQLMGGSLKVKSTPGVGSLFYFECLFQATEQERLPLPGAVESETTAAADRSLRILVAEDNIVNQRLILRFLENAGHQVSLASNGNEALSHYQQGNFDLILMDIQMPEKGGVEATAEIRSLESETRRQKIPIVALTAHALEGDREKYLGLGMDGYVSKPINRRELFRVIEELSGS